MYVRRRARSRRSRGQRSLLPEKHPETTTGWPELSVRDCRESLVTRLREEPLPHLAIGVGPIPGVVTHAGVFGVADG